MGICVIICKSQCVFFICIDELDRFFVEIKLFYDKIHFKQFVNYNFELVCLIFVASFNATKNYNIMIAQASYCH